MATLFRCRTPTDWLCPCGRVARTLRASGIEYDQVRVRGGRVRDNRDEVRAISGQSHVPLLVLDGEAICDSRRIVEHLRWREAQERAGPGRDAA
jgi:glutathione S-transferase